MPIQADLPGRTARACRDRIRLGHPRLGHPRLSLRGGRASVAADAWPATGVFLMGCPSDRPP
jgi:hypothetical protein